MVCRSPLRSRFGRAGSRPIPCSDTSSEKASPLYRHLKKLNTGPKGSGEVGWNFEKFLIDRNGEVIARFDPRTKPDDPAIVGKIKAALAQKK